MTKSRNWCFTINNPGHTTASELKSCSQIKLLVASLEVAETGTLHYQGYLELKNPRAISYLKSLNSHGHWERRRGSQSQAISYVLKTFQLDAISAMSVDTAYGMEYNTSGTMSIIKESMLDPWICVGFAGTFGDLTESLKPKKARTLEDRLIAIQGLIANGTTEEEISQDHFYEWCRFRSAFRDYRLLHTKARDFKSYVIVVQGPTGTGKSRWAAETYPGAYWKSRDNWWCNYQQEDEVVLDEFYGWMSFDFLLRLCDRYPLDVEVKGGKVAFASRTIIITTNKRPDQWYRGVYFPAFIRRVDEWWVFGTCFRSRYKKYDEVKFIDINIDDQSGDIDNDINKLSIS